MSLPIPDVCPFRKGVDYQARKDIYAKGGFCDYPRCCGGGGEYTDCTKFSKWFWMEAAKGREPRGRSE